MATDIDIIRSLIQDKPLYQSDSVTTDGTESVAQVQYFPVVGDTVTVTPDPSPITYTVEEDNGVITFSGPLPFGTYTITYYHMFLTDDDLNNILGMSEEGADLRLAAADALDAMASSQVMILKKIKLLDLQTDGPAVADALRKHAKELRAVVHSDDYVEAYFDIAEQVYDKPSWSEKIFKDIMRES